MNRLKEHSHYQTPHQVSSESVIVAQLRWWNEHSARAGSDKRTTKKGIGDVW